MTYIRLPEQARKLLVSEIQLMAIYDLTDADVVNGLRVGLPHVYATIGKDTTPHVYYKESYDLYTTLSFYYLLPE